MDPLLIGSSVVLVIPERSTDLLGFGTTGTSIFANKGYPKKPYLREACGSIPIHEDEFKTS